MNYSEIFPLAFETLNEIGEARQEWVGKVIALVEAKEDLALANAISRRDATQAAGGAKGLGSNADLREQALIIVLKHDPVYQASVIVYNQAFEQEARARQAMMTLSDALSLFKVALTC